MLPEVTKKPAGHGLFAASRRSILPSYSMLISSGGQILGVRTETPNFVTFTVHCLETASPTAMGPTLEVVWIPEPGPITLLADGALALFLRRRTCP